MNWFQKRFNFNKTIDAISTLPLLETFESEVLKFKQGIDYLKEYNYIVGFCEGQKRFIEKYKESVLDGTFNNQNFLVNIEKTKQSVLRNLEKKYE